jgi:hypothetical protein
MNEALRAQIVARLHLHQQAASYGAVAGLVGGLPRTVMFKLRRNQANSWVVNRRTQLPTHYTAQERDPHLIAAIQQSGVIVTPAALAQWLASHP